MKDYIVRHLSKKKKNYLYIENYTKQKAFIKSWCGVLKKENENKTPNHQHNYRKVCEVILKLSSDAMALLEIATLSFLPASFFPFLLNAWLLCS